jgi:hypothetical protein
MPDTRPGCEELAKSNSSAEHFLKCDIKIGRGTHLMHLETMRPALWQESINFLLANDTAAVPT